MLSSPGVNFINVFFVRIFCTNGVSAAFSSYVLAFAKKFIRKMRAFNVDEIDYSLGETEFTTCFKDKFRPYLESIVNCSTPYFDDYLGKNTTIKECLTAPVKYFKIEKVKLSSKSSFL